MSFNKARYPDEHYALLGIGQGLTRMFGYLAHHRHAAGEAAVHHDTVLAASASSLSIFVESGARLALSQGGLLMPTAKGLAYCALRFGQVASRTRTKAGAKRYAERALNCLELSQAFSTPTIPRELSICHHAAITEISRQLPSKRGQRALSLAELRLEELKQPNPLPYDSAANQLQRDWLEDTGLPQFHKYYADLNKVMGDKSRSWIVIRQAI